LVRVVGEGSRLWRAEVVLWIQTPDGAAFESFASALMSQTTAIDDAHTGVPEIAEAWSYDIQPPEGGTGVAFWVLSDTVGAAADAAWNAVRQAAAATLGQEGRLWDLRLIPGDAIIAAPDAGTPLYSG
jgi:hypothetical protein